MFIRRSDLQNFNGWVSCFSEEAKSGLKVQPGEEPLRAFFALIFVLLSSAAAEARWKREYAEQPVAVQDWYRKAKIMPAARHRFSFTGCCEHADVVKTKFNVVLADGEKYPQDAWFWLDGDRWRRVPDDVIHWGEHAPDGQPTLFVYSGRETCFYPPGEDAQ